MEDQKEYLEIDLMELLKALWHRAWAIALAVVLFGAAALAWTKLMITPLYEASALLYVNNSSFSVGSTSVSISPSELSAAQSLVDTYAVILKTRTTLNSVIRETGVDYTYEELVDMISAKAVNGTEVFSVTVTSPDPQEAEKLANTIAKILPEKISGIVDGSSVRVVDQAVVPAKKSSPSISKNTMLGMILGFVVSCGVIVLIQLFDTTIRSEDYLIQNYDLPLLAVIPELLPKRSGSGGYYYAASQPKARAKEEAK